MKPIKEYKEEVLERLEQLLGAGKERDLFPIDLRAIGRVFEIENLPDEIHTINESDVTYDNNDNEDWESEFSDLTIEDLGEIIDILETVIEDYDVDDEKTQKRISN
jgi:hypothetical protein